MKQDLLESAQIYTDLIYNYFKNYCVIQEDHTDNTDWEGPPGTHLEHNIIGFTYSVQQRRLHIKGMVSVSLHELKSYLSTWGISLLF